MVGTPAIYSVMQQASPEAQPGSTLAVAPLAAQSLAGAQKPCSAWQVNSQH